MPKTFSSFAGGRKHPLPFPFAIGIGELSTKSIWQWNTTITFKEILFMLRLNICKVNFYLVMQARWKSRPTILVSLSCSNHHLSRGKIKILDPQLKCFKQSQTTPYCIVATSRTTPSKRFKGCFKTRS